MDEQVAVATPEAAPVESAPVETTPVDASQPTETAPAETDPALSALEEALKAGLPEETPVEGAPEGEQPPVAAEFAPLLKVSPFVTSPEHVQTAIQAADEVWKVATGQLPARVMLEGMRSNPQMFESIIGDLVPYIEQVTGKKFGGAPDAAPDPVQERLNAIEGRFKQEQESRQQAAYQQQMTKAREVALETLTKATKGTFLEGDEAYALVQIAGKVGIPERDMVNLLLQGKTDEISKAFKQYYREEYARVAKWSERLVKNHRTLKNAVPATKGAAPDAPKGAPLARKDGESEMDFAKRVWAASA